MEKIKKLSEEIKDHQLKSWEQLPDLDIYKDQLLIYLSGRLPFEEERDRITGAMINNYTKAGIVPRTVGKRYQREHIAALTAIRILKQVLSVSEVALFLDIEGAKSDTEDFYERLLEALNREGEKTGEKLSEIQDDKTLREGIMSFALSAYLNALACKQLLRLAKGESKEEKTAAEPEEAK